MKEETSKRHFITLQIPLKGRDIAGERRDIQETFHYFADTTERKGYSRWKEAQRQGEDRVTIWMTLLSHWRRRIIIIKKSLVNGESVWIFPSTFVAFATYQSSRTILGGLHFTSLHFTLQLHTCKINCKHWYLCVVCLMLWHMEIS